MAAIDNLVNVTITAETDAVQVASFAVPMILGATDAGWGGDHVRTYSAPADMLSDGFTAETPEYRCAVAMYSGTTTPTEFKVGLRTTADMATDLGNIYEQDDGAYGLVLAGLPDTDIIPAADEIESRKKLFIAHTVDGTTATTVDTDLGSQMQAKGYKRSGLIYSPANPGGTVAAAWMGSQLPATPGTNNWAYCQLPGQIADNLSSNARSILYGTPISGQVGKNVNCYTRVAGTNITLLGKAAGGQFFDITVGVDWLESQIQAAIYSQLLNTPKVPYTNAGLTSLMNGVNQVLQIAVANGLIDGNDAANPVYVKAASIDSVTANQRAQRIAPVIYFGGRLQGAFNAVAIQGTVQA